MDHNQCTFEHCLWCDVNVIVFIFVQIFAHCRQKKTSCVRLTSSTLFTCSLILPSGTLSKRIWVNRNDKYSKRIVQAIRMKESATAGYFSGLRRIDWTIDFKFEYLRWSENWKYDTWLLTWRIYYACHSIRVPVIQKRRDIWVPMFPL